MIYKRLRHYAVTQRTTLRSWSMRMKGLPCFLIGNGPSLSDQPVRGIEPYFSIGVNRAFKLIDPTILMWQDIELWITERKFLNKLKAVKYCRDVADPENIAYHFKLSNGGYKIPKDPLLLCGRGSTGPLAFQLACLLGCSPIILLGYDCKYRGKKTDFWGKNRFHKPHTLTNCSRGLKWIKATSDNNNIEIINCSDNDVFENRCSLDSAISQVKDKYSYVGRDILLCMLFGLLCDASDDPSLKHRKKP